MFIHTSLSVYLGLGAESSSFSEISLRFSPNLSNCLSTRFSKACMFSRSSFLVVCNSSLVFKLSSCNIFPKKATEAVPTPNNPQAKLHGGTAIAVLSVVVLAASPEAVEYFLILALIA